MDCTVDELLAERKAMRSAMTIMRERRREDESSVAILSLSLEYILWAGWLGVESVLGGLVSLPPPASRLPSQFLHTARAVRLCACSQRARGAADLLLSPQAVWPSCPPLSPGARRQPGRHHACCTARFRLTRAAVGRKGGQARGQSTRRHRVH
jgi:hypothetical protein